MVVILLTSNISYQSPGSGFHTASALPSLLTNWQADRVALTMAFYEVYSHPALIRYKTSVCTKATLFLFVVTCLTYIAPLLVAYRSQGNCSLNSYNWSALINKVFSYWSYCVELAINWEVTLIGALHCVIPGFWTKRSTYEEQPVVRFQYQVLLVAATSTRGDYVAWSTFPHLNRMLGSDLRIPSLSVSDQLYFSPSSEVLNLSAKGC